LFRNRTRSAKRLARRIEQTARRRGEEAKEALKGSYERLVEVAKATLKQAGKVRQMLPPEARRGLAVELERFEGLLGRAVGQTERRVLEGESVPAAEKLVSLFEEHTSIIRRGKAGKETDYGHKVWLEETEGAIISGYRVLEGNPADRDQLLAALEHHEQRFGRPPRLVAADRGVHSPENERECRKRGIERVCLPKAGRKSQQRREHERQGWFRGGRALGRGSRDASACPSGGGS
jgi:IS5 family transposase